jgi:hypothetical protein
MKHARDDYNDRIIDTDNEIPGDEPVFLIRAQDQVSGDAVRAWADLHEKAGGDSELAQLARDQAELMDAWPVKKAADKPNA